MNLLRLVATLSFAGFCLAQAEGLRVAIVPLLNVSGEKWEDLKAKQINKGDEYLRSEFAKRGFSVLPADQVATAMGASNVDFSDEEQQKRSVLFDLGKRLHADFILLGVITDTTQIQRSRTLYTDVEGLTHLKLWLLDVRNQEPILSSKKVTGRSGGSRLGYDNKGSDRQVQATVNALRDGLKGFFERYPVRK